MNDRQKFFFALRYAVFMRRLTGGPERIKIPAWAEASYLEEPPNWRDYQRERSEG